MCVLIKRLSWLLVILLLAVGMMIGWSLDDLAD
jgi:hypothetical protein